MLFHLNPADRSIRWYFIDGNCYLPATVYVEYRELLQKYRIIESALLNSLRFDRKTKSITSAP